MALKPYRATAHWKRIRLQVLRRDAYTCAYCGDVADQVDHVYPKSRGGEDSSDNLVAACKKCNYAKRDRTDFFLSVGSTPPAFVNSISPIRTNANKSDKLSVTNVKISADSPFIDPDQSGAN